MIDEMRAAIFDLDGVIVDTAKYHFLAWKRLAERLGFDFTQEDNEMLKGVSRERSLEILLAIGGFALDEAARSLLAEQKNRWYVEYIQTMDASEMLPGASRYLLLLRERGVKTALASASRNAAIILQRLGIASLFDAVIDGTHVRSAKPDPEVFIRAAEALGVAPRYCVVFEDSQAGIEAARRVRMGTVGIGRPESLKEADAVVAGLHQLLALLPQPSPTAAHS